MSGEQVRPSDAEPGHAWDAVAEERERLADERERLADTREHLANERERLADEQERLLDERRDATALERDVSGDHDEVQARGDAEAELARADARVERAIAERERAEAMLERRIDAESRTAERAARELQDAQAEHLSDDELAWSQERRSFVASDRQTVAHARDELQDVRDELADRRERLADERDVADRARETAQDARSANSRRTTAGGARARTARAHADLEEIREAARRQRRTATLGRERDRTSRAGAGGSELTPTAYGPGLTGQFAALTRELFASQDLAAIGRRVIDFAVQSVPNCVAAGVALLPAVTPTLQLTTDAVAQRLDRLQIELGEGPIADALAAPDPVYVAVFDERSRWSDLAQVAIELEVSSMVAYGLAVPRDGSWQPLGTLTLYAEAPDAFDAEVRELGGTISCYLSVAAALERDRTDLTRREAALHRALGTRDIIGQAKGILMERRHLTAGEAFDTLRETSQRLNIAVHEIATHLAESGELPD